MWYFGVDNSKWSSEVLKLLSERFKVGLMVNSVQFLENKSYRMHCLRCLNYVDHAMVDNGYYAVLRGAGKFHVADIRFFVPKVVREILRYFDGDIKVFLIDEVPEVIFNGEPDLADYVDFIAVAQDTDELEAFLEDGYSYVALGGNALFRAKNEAVKRLVDAYRLAKKYNAYIHALGVGKLELAAVVNSLGYDSVDTSAHLTKSHIRKLKSGWKRYSKAYEYAVQLLEAKCSTPVLNV